MKPIRKGMVLAAGLGTRLLPITEKLPKPLVPVLNIPNILYSLFLLKKHGITEIIINLHHLGDKIKNALGDGKELGLSLSYSYEPVLLGTGGGVKKVESFFEGETFLLVNCDFLCDFYLNEALDFHVQKKSWATMILWENKRSGKKYSSVGIDDQSQICLLGKHSTVPAVQSGMFTGIHILEPEIFSYLKEEPSGINELLYPNLMKEHPDKAMGYFMDPNTFWYDTGEKDTLLDTSISLLKHLPKQNEWLPDEYSYQEKLPGVWALEPVSPLLEELTLTPPVLVGNHCHFPKHTKLGPNTIVSDNTTMDEPTELSDTVILFSRKVSKADSLKKGLIY